MADHSAGSNGKPEGAGAIGGDVPQIQVQLIGQFIKDLSFENPNIAKMLDKKVDSPDLRVEINVNAQKVGPDLFESSITFNGHAASKKVVVYDLELVYTGLFRLQNIPEEALEPFLLVNCPNLLFPFLRRIVADVTRDGGFPPLMLEPMDFGALFMRRKQKEAAGSKADA